MRMPLRSSLLAFAVGLLVAVPVGLHSQAGTYSSGTVLTFGGTLPGTCNAGELYAKNTATVGLNICTASNTWTAVATGTVSLLPLHLTDANTVEQYNGVTGQGFYLYNTRTDASNNEYLRFLWSGDNAFIQTDKNGSGTQRPITILAGGNLTLWSAAHTGNYQELAFATTGATLTGTSSGATPVRLIASTISQTSGTYFGISATSTYQVGSTSTMVGVGLHVNPTINYSAGTPGAGSYEAIRIAATETALPTGQSYLIRALAGSAGTTDIWSLDNKGVQRNTGVTFANLPGTPSNGMFVYCTDCTIASPCAGSGTGAFAKRLNGAWICN